MQDKIFYEIFKELLATNKNIEEQLNKFTNKQLDTLEEILTRNQQQSLLLQQMAEYLKNPQTIVDYVVKDYTKQNERMMQQLARQFKKACLLFNPEIVGMNRPNFKILSSPTEPVYVNQNTSTSSPVYTVNSTDLIQYAENAYAQVYNTAYYRVGYLPNLSTSFASVNDSSSTVTITDVMSTAQTLNIKSSNANDTEGGSGVQIVLVGGLDASGNRYSQPITLAGTTEVSTGTFLQVDSLFAIATGSNNGAAGNITLYKTIDTTTTTYGVIYQNNNAWRSGRFYADTMASAYIDAWCFGSFTDAVRTQLQTSVQTGNYSSFITRAAVIVQNNTTQLAFPVPIRIPKNMAGRVRAISKATGGGTEVTTSFELHFITE